MSGSQLQVRLYRDSFNTPWGFRLQGGKDLGQSLSVQRVFSNSPAEGELQRGDSILSIGGRAGNELTHKQALDLIKHGGGQIQLVIQRPAPGRVTSTATFKPQRPRAPSLQLSPVYPAMPGPSYSDQQHRPQHGNPCYNPNFLHQISPSSPHHPPPWAIQNFEPKKVSRLSRLGGGGLDFGIDYGAQYGTVPRRRHSTQVASSTQHLQSAGGNPARVASLSRLGGGGFDFGTDYCTLPRKPHRQASQPPASQQTMPAPGGYGFQPKKVTLSSLGGGGPEFGSDFTSYRPSVTQPVHVHTGGRGPQHNVDMLNRVQESLDNISLSPRTPDYYQPPPFASPISGTGYIPTGVRLDMEREQELRRQQQHQQQQQYQSAPQYYHEPQQPYVSTGVRLDQQTGEEEQEEIQPVWERRRAFMNAPSKSTPVTTGKSSAPKILRPKPGPSAFTFGVDYSKPSPKTSSVTWKPQAVQRPVNVPPHQKEVKMTSVSWTPAQSAPPSEPVPPPAPVPPPKPREIVQSSQPAWSGQVNDDMPQVPPAWRTSLKSTGVKPWDSDLEYTAGQQQTPRSVGFQPKAPGAAPFNPAPTLPQQGGGGQDGPQVVHLQYNSPIGLYSRENVQETYTGQTKALAAGGSSPGGSAQAQNPPKPGDRDWTQSAVYRMIYEDEHRGRGSSQQQQQKAPPPPPPKPQTQSFQQGFAPMDDEFGTSDF